MSNVVFNAILTLDPTRTTVLRNKFSAEMYKRFRWVKGLIRKSIIDNDCFGYNLQTTQDRGYTSLTLNQPTPTNAFAFERDPKKIQLFQKWLQEQTDKGILEIIPGTQIGDAVEDAWTNQYIQTAYQKGIARGRQELINANYAVPALADTGGMNAVFNSPFHLDRVGLIYTRAFTGLKKITDEMSGQISSVLAEGMAQGLNPLEMAQNINNRVDKIGITRARTLARTEVIRAHHYATIQEYENWGAEGVEVMVEWATAGYRVCGRCAALEGEVYTLQEIRTMIPLHPNCRCCSIPKKKETGKKKEKPVEKIETEEFVDLSGKTQEDLVTYFGAKNAVTPRPVEDYARSWYRHINSPLRKGDAVDLLDDDLQEVVTGLDAILQENSLQEGLKLQRGLKFDADTMKDFIDAHKQGVVFKDRGFVSTSVGELDSYFTRGEKIVKMEIRAGKGTKGQYLPSWDEFRRPEELEFLLPRDTEFKVLSVGEEIDGQVEMVVEVQK